MYFVIIPLKSHSKPRGYRFDSKNFQFVIFSDWISSTMEYTQPRKDNWVAT